MCGKALKCNLGSPGGHRVSTHEVISSHPWPRNKEAEIIRLLKERGRSDLNNYLYFRQNGTFYYVMQIQIMDFFM